jgi:hypothetical protein
MKPFFPLVLSVFALAACDGPNEQAGEKQDETAAAASGVEYTGSGPAERAGEVRDKAANAARKSAEADAAALKAEAINVERKADVTAEKFDAEADSVRV